MKRKNIIALALFAGTLVSQADNVMVADVIVPQGGQSSLAINYQFDVTELYSGYQFALVLPEGVTTVKDGGGVATFVAGDCHDSSYTISSSFEEGEDLFVALSLKSYPLTGTEGVLLTIPVIADGNLEVGTNLSATLKNIQLGNKDGVHTTQLKDVTFNIVIGEPVAEHTILDETSTTAPEAASGVDVRVRRTIAAGEWNTICLPFAMTEAQTKQAFGNDVQLADFTGYDVTENADAEIAGITVHFQGVTAIEANHPYIIKVAAPVTEFTVDGVDITPEEEPTNATIKRTRKAWSEMTGTYTAGFTVPEQTLFLSGGKFWYSTGQTKMKAFRAYFDFYDVLAEVENASVKMVVNFGDETGLSSVSSSVESSMYDIQGRKVQGQNAQKGIYIINGKKILK